MSAPVAAAAEARGRGEDALSGRREESREAWWEGGEEAVVAPGHNNKAVQGEYAFVDNVPGDHAFCKQFVAIGLGQHRPAHVLHAFRLRSQPCTKQ